MNAIFFNDFKNSYIPDILDEIYIKKVYEPFLLGRKDLTIVDIGANIGLASFYFKDYAKTVYAVEPAKQHQETIEQLIKFNKIENITLCKYAISNQNGKTKFYHNENTTMFSLASVVNEKGDDFEEVETLDFNEFLKRNTINEIDLLKLDVEGTECEILASDAFKDNARKIAVICGEWHAWAKCEKPQFANMFRDLGFSFKWLSSTKASVFSATRI